MKSRTVLILAALVIAAVVFTLVLERDPTPAGNDRTGERLLPTLETALNDVTAVTVDAGGEDGRTTLRRNDTGWVVAERSDYPADAGQIRQLLIRLSDASVVESKTRNPDYYGRLGVGDVGADGGGVQVTLEGVPEPVSVIVGNQETRAGTGTYLRLAGEEQSYLVSAQLDPARTPVGWLDESLIDVEAADVEFIEVRQDDGAVLRIERGDDGLAVLDLPAGRSLASDTAPRSMAGVLRSFTLDDVRPATDFADEPPAAVAEYGLADGRVLTARLWQRDDGRYAALRVAFAPPAANAATAAPSTDDPATAVEPADEETGAPDDETDTPDTGREDAADDESTADPAATAAAAADLDARLAPWVFKIPAHKYDLMARRLDDLLAAPTLE